MAAIWPPRHAGSEGHHQTLVRVDDASLLRPPVARTQLTGLAVHGR
jgi:hypothetical protein